MQDKLFIYLNSNDATNPSWATGSYTHRGETESLAQAALDREVVVIVPAEDVLLMMVKLPKMSRRRLQQALPFALEEQLIAEVDDLHFATGTCQKEGQEDGGMPVAIVSREKMQQWLALLKSWQVTPSVMIPLTLTLPYESGTWSVLKQEIVVVRTGLFSGFACDKHNYLNVISVPTGIKEVFLNPEQMTRDLAPLNLLQGAYAVKKSNFLKWPKIQLGWKVAVNLAIAWVFLLFLYPSISCFILKQRMNAIDSQIAVIYKRHFPQAGSVVAPKLRLQEKWQDLSAKIGENKSLLLIGFIGKGVLELPAINIKRIDFQNEQLTLALTAPTSEDLSAFTHYLTAQGLSVKQQSASLAGGRISATLQIE